MIDKTLINYLTALANEEKKINEFKRRLRIKGNVSAKTATKKENITLTIKKDDEEYKFTILKSHKERYALASKIDVGRNVSAEGIHKFRIIICTSLKILDKGISQGKQAKLEKYS